MADDRLPSRTARKVAVLACTYNGERFLRPQLDSLRAQTLASVDLWVSDDSSRDGTLALLGAEAREWAKGDFRLLKGPRRGFAENFRSLMVRDTIEADYFAFCDQDDVWDADKLEAAADWLDGIGEGVPALYCSRTRIIDSTGATVGHSELFERPPTFRNALVQSIAGGNTMVFNRAARDIIAEGSRRTPFVSHDWWCYLLVTGAGGRVHYGAEPRIGYRQHDANLVGENNSVLSRLSRYAFLYRGGFAGWMDRNVGGLQACRDLLSEDALDVFDRFARIRSSGVAGRLAELARSRVYRQTVTGTAGLYVACAINRL